MSIILVDKYSLICLFKSLRLTLDFRWSLSIEEGKVKVHTAQLRYACVCVCVSRTGLIFTGRRGDQ